MQDKPSVLHVTRHASYGFRISLRVLSGQRVRVDKRCEWYVVAERVYLPLAVYLDR
jgi:hypothetical protein